MKSIAFLFGLAVLHAACVEAMAGDRDAAIQWLDARYREIPMGMGWRVVEVEAAGTGARVVVTLPTRHADLLSKRAVSLQVSAVGSVACPGPEEAVWALVGSADDIYVRLFSAASPDASFIEVACRDFSE